jgi:hypothetical protein
MSDEAKEKANGSAALIQRKPVSKRSPVTEEQARFLAILIQELADEYRMETQLQGRDLTLEAFFDLAAYRRFLHGAYACGFVCRDFKPDFPIDDMLIRPEESLTVLPFHRLRHYIHTLMRAERWSDSYSSPIRTALEAGALGVAQRRLLEDETLFACG